MIKAAVVTADKKVAIVSKKLRPLEHGEALLKMVCCGVCHSDVTVARHVLGDTTGLTLGHEGIGTVKEIGPGVKSLKIGDRCSVSPLFYACGNCHECVSGYETFCGEKTGAGFSVDGGMAEECIVKADYAVKVPSGLDSSAASSITCGGVTVYKALKEANVKAGQWVVMFGAGGLGNLGIQFAKNVFNAKVIAIDVNEAQLAFAKETGAEIIINPVKEDAVKIIQEKIGGAHACIVTATAVQAFNSAPGTLRARGHMVVVGLPPEEMKLDILPMLTKGIHISGSAVGTRNDLAEAFQFAAEGKVIPKCTLRKIEEINDIFEEMEAGKYTGRMVITFN